MSESIMNVMDLAHFQQSEFEKAYWKSKQGKSFGELLGDFVNDFGWDVVKQTTAHVREVNKDDDVYKEYPAMLKLVYLYPTPIEKDTKVIEAVVIGHTEDEDGDYQMIAEDGEIYTDTLDCVSGKNRDEVQRILDELRDDMIASGEIETI